MKLMYSGIVAGLILAVIAAGCISAGNDPPAATSAPVRSSHGGWTTPAEQGPILSVAFNPSGDRLLAAGPDGVDRILDVQDGSVVAIHKQRNLRGCYGNAALYSNDGKSIASAAGGREVEEWDPATGKTIRRLDVGAQQGSASDQSECGVSLPVAFSPDNRLLAVEAEWNQPVHSEVVLFDLASGKKRRVFPLENYFNIYVPLLSMGRATFRSDGKELAVAHFTGKIHIFSLESPDKARELPCPGRTACALAVSCDGRMLAAAVPDRVLQGSFAQTSPFDPKNLEYHAIPLWDLTTGRQVLALKGHWEDVWSVAYSSDGRLILSGGVDKTVRLWEALSGQELHRWDFDAKVNYVTMSPDCKKVAAALFIDNDRFNPGEWKSSVACFPLERPEPDRPAPPLESADFAPLWVDLASDDAKQAYKAVQTLTGAAEAAPKWLRERLRTVPRVPAAELARLIADLDADDFDRREAASKQLADFGLRADAALRKALDVTTSAEVRSRIRPLLKPPESWVVIDPDTLRVLRAIWVLERIGTPEAQAVLEDLAGGAPEVRQTQEAKAALDFLDKRAAAAKP